MLDFESLQILVEAKGVILEVNAKGNISITANPELEPELLEAVRAHKPRFLQLLTKAHAPSTDTRVMPRLPWELERLVSAAGNATLPDGSIYTPKGIITNLNLYVLAWAAAYLTGATEDARTHLWEAWYAWQGNKASA
jgi:hypothetical protein